MCFYLISETFQGSNHGTERNPKVIIACLRQVVAFAPKVIKMRRLQRRTREGRRYGRMGGRRERARGEGQGGGIGLALLWSKKKGGNYALFYFTGKRFFFNIYDVITWEKQKKSSANHYSCPITLTNQHRIFPFAPPLSRLATHDALGTCS